MSNQLVNCPKCRRHYFIAKGSCPFCASPTDSRLARYAMAAMTPMVLGACYGSPKDSGYRAYFGDSGGDTGATTSTAVGDGTGVYGLAIENNCNIGWDLSGTYAGSGADYTWSAELTVNDDLTDCGGASDTAGALVAVNGSTYFDNRYIGVASYADRSLSWATEGYVAGTTGGSYAYDGNIRW